MAQGPALFPRLVYPKGGTRHAAPLLQKHLPTKTHWANGPEIGTSQKEKRITSNCDLSAGIQAYLCINGVPGWHVVKTKWWKQQRFAYGPLGDVPRHPRPPSGAWRGAQPSVRAENNFCLLTIGITCFPALQQDYRESACADGRTLRKHSEMGPRGSVQRPRRAQSTPRGALCLFLCMFDFM